MKKIIASIFGFALLFIGQTTFASSSIWNNASNDCSDIAIANYTTNSGYGTPCWTGTNINANPGDTINVRVYYHNTEGPTATNTRIKVFAPTGSSTSHSFSAQILSTAPNGNLYTSNVNVTLPSSQNLTYVTAKWFPNQSTVAAPFLNGQSGSEVLSSGGLYIGDIAQGWSTQGTVVVAFKVGNTQPPTACSIENLSAEPSTVSAGGSSTIFWNTVNCNNVKLNGVPVNTYGSKLFNNIQSTTTYTLTGNSSNGTIVSKSVTVNVNQPQSTCSIESLSAEPSTINAGGSSTIFWNTVNCSNVKLNGVPVNTYGSKLFNNIQSTTTYTLTGSSSNGTTKSDSVVVTVNPVVLSCVIDNFTADPSSILAGSSSTLSWNTTGCNTVKLFNGSTLIGNFGPDSNKTVSPTITTTYTLKAYKLDGTLGDTSYTKVTVGNIVPNGCKINSFTASPSTIQSGDSSDLTWDTTNCVSANINSSLVQVSGSKTVNPLATTIYKLTAMGSNGLSQTKSVTVYVNNVTQNCIISSFTASPLTIQSGESSILTWSTINCTSVTISNLGYNVPNSGSQPVYPTTTTTYVVTATSSYGFGQTRNVTVVVNNVINNYCTINNFTSNPSSITNGDSSTLIWDTTNCDNITIDGVSVSNPSGSKVVWPILTKTYTLSASKSFGPAPVTAKTTVYVNDNNDNNTCDIVNFSATDTSIEDGDYTTLKWNTTDCDYVKITDLGTVSDDGSETVSPNEDTTYVLTAYDFNGSHKTASVRIYVDSNGNDNNDCSIDSYTASDTYINKGDDVTLKWRTTGCNDVRISSIGTVSDDGSETVSPYVTTTYLLKAYGNGGSDSESIKVNVDYNNNDDVVYNTNVVTTVATNISQTGAQLNGLITNTNYNSYNNTNTYFSYGTNVNLGMRTPSRSVGGNTNFSDYVTSLAPNTIYYFRAIAEGPNGVSYGAIEVFRTLGYTNNYNYNDNTTVRTVRQVVYQQGTTVLPSASPIMLQIGNKYQMIGTGDMVEYTVYYKNISSSTLTSPMVQVFIPKGITLTNTSRGTYSVEDRTLSVPIENLNPGDEGYIYLQARVDSLDMNSAQIVTTAILIYTNPNGAQENAMAYVLNNPRGGNNLLGASAFFGGMFGMGLIGWLILIIVIMLLILLSRSYYGRKSVTTTVTHQ